VRLLPRHFQWRPDPEPLEVDARPVVAAGTAVWAVLLVVAVVRRDQLAADGHSWWVWTPVVGIALGLCGMDLLRRRDRQLTPLRRNGD
jgi:hypothetical protein